MIRSLAATVSDPAFIRGIDEALHRISQSSHAAEVTAIVEDIADMLGCNGAVFTSFTKDDEDFESYRHIAACAASWCARYVEQRWFAIDPFLIYAQQHTELAVGDEIPLRTEGQRQFRLQARAEGFHSIAVVPCHTAAGRSRMGVLYLTSEDPDYFTRETIVRAKMCLRTIAAELLEWWSRKIRSGLLCKLNLRADDVHLLRLAQQGFRSKEIALLLDIKPATVDQRFARLALKLNVPSRTMAVKRAFENGLLDE